MTWRRCVGMVGMLVCASCGNDRPAPTQSPGSPPQTGATAVSPSIDATAATSVVRLDAPMPTAGARTVQVSVADGPAADVEVSGTGQIAFTLVAASPTAVLTLGNEQGTGRLTMVVALPTVDVATLGLTGDGRLVPPLTLPLTVDNSGGKTGGNVVIHHGPDASTFARVRTGPLKFDGEGEPTSTGVIDFLDGAAYYQGAAGPFSNARYLAFATAVVGPTMPCDGTERPSTELDLTVIDRFAGRVAGKQRFRPTPACTNPSFTVGPTVVRAWLRSQFVRDGN